MQLQRHLKIFISSTFQDMEEEREVLLKNTFLELKKIAKSRDVEVTEIDLRTGVTKEQAESGEVVKICLDEIERCADSPIFFLGMLGNRYGSVNWIGDVNKNILEDKKYSWITNFSNKSLTEIEIISALDRNQKHNRAFIYLKEGIDDNSKLTELKNWLIAKSEDNKNIDILHYKDISEFREKTILSFTKALDALYPKDEKISEVERLRHSHQIFAKSRQKIYISHAKNEMILNEFIDSDQDRLLLYGESGYGKSALIANYFEKFKQDNDSFVIEHYIGGAGEFSNDLHQMLRRIILEIKGEFNLPQEVPTKPQKIIDEFAQWLYLVKRPTIIILDGYNQIEDELKEKLFYYIPEQLEKVKLIISSIKDNYPIDNKYKIEALSKEEKQELIIDYLTHYGKEGMALKIYTQISTHPQTDNTLFLRTLLNEIRLLGNFDNIENDINNYLQAKNVVELFIKIFERLEGDYRTNLAQEVLSLLYVSREGLSEDNLMEIINQNSTDKLTRLEFSPLFLALEEHLINKNGLYGFFHDYIREAVKNRYLNSLELINIERKKIADYFEKREIDNQRVRELPYQLYNLKDRDRLYRNLVDIDFFFKIVDIDDEALEYETLKYIQFIDKKYDISKDIVSILLKSNNIYQISRIALFLTEVSSRYKESLLLFERSLKLQIDLFGENHSKTSQSYMNLGMFHERIGNFKKAYSLYNKALNIRKSIFGEYNIDTIASYCSIIRIYKELDLYDVAIEIAEKVISIASIHLGNNHLETLQLYNELGVIYSIADKNIKAYDIHLENLNKHIQINGYWSSFTAQSYANLSESLFSLGKYEDSLKYNKKALEIYQKLFGQNHPDTLIVNRNQGVYLYSQSQFEKSIEIFKYIIKIQEQLFEKKCPHLILSYLSIADSYVSISKYTKAQIFIKKALDISTYVYGEFSLSSGKIYNSFGYYYKSIKDYKMSIKYYKKSIVCYKRIKEYSKVELLDSTLNLISIYFDITYEYDKAIIYLNKILALKEYFKNINFDTISTYNILGVSYFKVKNYKEAYKWYNKTLKLACKKEDISYQSVSYNNLAKLYVAQKEYKKALPLYEKTM